MTEPVLLEISDRLLELYADSELPEAQRASVENAIRRRPELVARIAAQRHTSTALHDCYDRFADAPLPKETRLLADRLTKRADRAGRVRRRNLWRAAAALPLVALLCTAAWWTGRTMDPPVRAVRAGGPVAANGGDGIVLATMGQQAVTRGPDLRRFGYELTEIVPPGEGDPETRLRYQGADGTGLSLYILQGNQGARQSMDFTQSEPATVLIWRDETGLFGLVGEASRELLNDMSHAVASAFSVQRHGVETQPHGEPLDAANKET